ncbi:glycosyltransferase family 2 protein [Pigmentibacter ruber]
MSLETPLISVIMPVYNASKFLNLAIDSILNQSFSQFEFICVFDKSKDDSLDILYDYQSTDSRIIVLENKGTGIVGALNTGIEISKGKYIARMDADDISCRDRLKIQYKFLEENQNCVVVCSNAISIDENGKEVLNQVFNSNLKVPPLEWLLIWENPIIHPTAMIRKKLSCNKAIYYPNHFAEDAALWRDLAFAGKIERLDKVLLYYRVSSASLFHSNISKNSISVLNLNNLYLIKFLGQQEQVPEFFSIFTSYYYFQKEIIFNEFVSKKDFLNFSYKLTDQLSKKFHYTGIENTRCKKYLEYLYLSYLVRKKCYLLFALHFIGASNYAKYVFFDKVFRKTKQKLMTCKNLDYKLKYRKFFYSYKN